MVGGDVPVAEGNIEIWRLLMLLNNQWLYGPAGLYGIDMRAVIAAAREVGFAVTWEFLEKVKAFEAEVLLIARKGPRGPCDEAQRKKCQAEFGSVHLDWICKNCEEMKDVK